MTHSDRATWLAAHNWLVAPSCRPLDLHQDGRLWVWLDGYRGLRPVSAWLAMDDGTVEMHGSRDTLTWSEFQGFVVAPVRESVEKPKRARSLFDGVED